MKGQRSTAPSMAARIDNVFTSIVLKSQSDLPGQTRNLFACSQIVHECRSCMYSIEVAANYRSSSVIFFTSAAVS